MKDWIGILFVIMCGLLALPGCGGARKQAIADARLLIKKSQNLPCETVRAYLEALDKELGEGAEVVGSGKKQGILAKIG